MASIERTAYPRFRASRSSAEREALYEPTAEEVAFAREHARSDRGRLTLLVLLKCHQLLGYLPPIRQVPADIRAYLAAKLGLPAVTPLGARSRQARHRYRQAVHAYLGVRTYSEGGRAVAAAAMREAAFTRSDPADLINVAIEELVRRRHELPAFSGRSTGSPATCASRYTRLSMHRSPRGSPATSAGASMPCWRYSRERPSPTLPA